MAQMSIADFARELKVQPAVLLEQLEAAGVHKRDAEDSISEREQSTLLDYLRRAHGASPPAREQAKPTPKILIAGSVNKKTLNLRADAPKLSALHRTAFGILGATTRDNRRRILELAEEKHFSLDTEICAKARSDLTNPRNRLAAELAWLPGLSPKRANAYCVLLNQDLDSVMRLAGDEGPLVQANLVAAALELLEPELSADAWAIWILALALEVDKIDPVDVFKTINEERAVAGIPEIQSLDVVEEELSARRRYYKDTIKGAMDRFPTVKMIQVTKDVVEVATSSGTKPAPVLIDELIDSFEVGARPFLEREEDNAKQLIKATYDSAAGGDRVVRPLLDKLERVVRNWDTVAKPIKINMNVRGLEHKASKALAYAIRDLGIDLYKNHGMLEQTQRITNLLQEVFAELPAVVDRLDEDSKAIESIFEQREQSKHQTAEWAKEITYEAQIGLVFKDTLRISPNGVEWKGVRLPLDSITGVGWGATRNSVNGIPTGTNYSIFYCDQNKVTWIQTNREQIFSSFTNKLWKAVGVRLLTEMLEGLRAGKRYQFGDAILDDRGMEFTKTHFLGADEKVRATWSQLQVWSADGKFFIEVKDNKKAFLALPYQASNNAHILEAAVRMKFKNGNELLSSLLG